MHSDDGASIMVSDDALPAMVEDMIEVIKCVSLSLVDMSNISISALHFFRQTNVSQENLQQIRRPTHRPPSLTRQRNPFMKSITAISRFNRSIVSPPQQSLSFIDISRSASVSSGIKTQGLIVASPITPSATSFAKTERSLSLNTSYSSSAPISVDTLSGADKQSNTCDKYEEYSEYHDTRCVFTIGEPTRKSGGPHVRCIDENDDDSPSMSDNGLYSTTSNYNSRRYRHHHR
ncbi:hypothetical protein BX616_010612 [Lobosporangium transversale]|uniref:Uncharacterized protein n=1 Tax=Lobosporangium transversale TaxID=64571 RepID=A0A1Y2GU02_9FUNG|nr:hypothetical protein BCR41DRAFT_394035 [Lobosporangium transversale]KAF9911329.1 hypothetical protein BX616_010612 [Lobosporangium transversale]ORZ23720.1 hypothetical protein BCR41DRAFT_394035 [Lobosporangium transversale]|eukprot:XP_021883534.1 hypothetical protein BCR41DRAFT_394035 [Lobosporangium transversale]